MLLESRSNILQEQGGLKRRSFLGGVIYTLTSLIGAAIAASVGSYVLGAPRQREETEWADAGNISGLRAGIPQQITFEQSRMDAWKARNEKSSAWIILNNQGSITAFSPLCTHLGCAYRWEAERRLFACPCHGSLFSATGDVIAGPAPRPLDRYTVKLEGSRLWLGPFRKSPGV